MFLYELGVTMNWNLAIEKNREALKRIVALLATMAGFSGIGGIGDPGNASGRPSTLPRHLHRFVLRLVRPAESAARRLVIVAARGLVVELAPPRVARPGPKPIPHSEPGMAL